MRAARRSYARMLKTRVTRKARLCNICEKTILPGERYGKTARGTVWCEKCGER